MLTMLFVALISIVGLTSAATLSGPPNSSSSLPSGPSFAAAVKSDFQTAANSFNRFTTILNAIKTRKTTDKAANLLHEIPDALFTNAENALTQIANTLKTIGEEFSNDITKFGQLYGETYITPNGYIQMPVYIQKMYLGIVRKLENITFKLGQDIDALGDGLQKIQKSAGPINATSVSAFFNSLIAAVYKAANSFTYGGNAWASVDNYLENVGKIIDADSKTGPNVFYNKGKFDSQIGGDFKDMLKAFGGISSSFDVLKNGINKMETILLQF